MFPAAPAFGVPPRRGSGQSGDHHSRLLAAAPAMESPTCAGSFLLGLSLGFHPLGEACVSQASCSSSSTNLMCLQLLSVAGMFLEVLRDL